MDGPASAAGKPAGDGGPHQRQEDKEEEEEGEEEGGAAWAAQWPAWRRQQRTALVLAIHAVRRQLLELWVVPHGPCLASWPTHGGAIGGLGDRGPGSPGCGLSPPSSPTTAVATRAAGRCHLAVVHGQPCRAVGVAQGEEEEEVVVRHCWLLDGASGVLRDLASPLLALAPS